MKIQNFEDIQIWQKGIQLVEIVYKFTKKEGFKKDFRLKDQIQGSAISVPSNIAEGFERQTNKEFKQFLYITKGSTGELRTQLFIAMKLGYISNEEFTQASELCFEISRMISGFIKYLDTQKSPLS